MLIAEHNLSAIETALDQNTTLVGAMYLNSLCAECEGTFNRVSIYDQMLTLFDLHDANEDVKLSNTVAQ